MIESIRLRNFKGFKDTLIEPLKKVNLIIGGQNVGKTSVLEAIFSVANARPWDMGATFRPSEGRDIERFTSSIFGPDDVSIALYFDDDSGVELTSAKSSTDEKFGRAVGVLGLGKHHSNRELNMFMLGKNFDLKENSCTSLAVHLPSQSALANLFGQVILARKKKELLNLLRLVEPRLESLDAIAPDGDQRVYAEVNGINQAVPISQMGHGFTRLVHLFSELLVTNSKVALIDEIENGIHYSALTTLLRGIQGVAVTRGIQSVITTHSWDCLRAACEVFAEAPDLFQVIRLERKGDNVQAVCIDGDRMLRMMTSDMEVR